MKCSTGDCPSLAAEVREAISGPASRRSRYSIEVEAVQCAPERRRYNIWVKWVVAEFESPGNLGLAFHMNPGLTSQLLNIPARERRTLPLFIIFSHHTVQSSSLPACCGTRQQIGRPLFTRSLLRYPQSRTQGALATSKERCSLSFWSRTLNVNGIDRPLL